MGRGSSRWAWELGECIDLDVTITYSYKNKITAMWLHTVRRQFDLGVIMHYWISHSDYPLVVHCYPQSLGNILYSVLTSCLFNRYLLDCCSLTKSCLTLRPQGWQQTRLPCPSPSPGACSNSGPSSGREPETQMTQSLL